MPQSVSLVLSATRPVRFLKWCQISSGRNQNGKRIFAGEKSEEWRHLRKSELESIGLVRRERKREVMSGREFWLDKEAERERERERVCVCV